LTLDPIRPDPTRPNYDHITPPTVVMEWSPMWLQQRYRRQTDDGQTTDCMLMTESERDVVTFA